MKATITPLLATLLLLSIVAAGYSQNTISGTPITSLPYVISESGTYFVASDLAANPSGGYAIGVFNTHDVVIDLNGHTMTDSSIGGVSGIYISDSPRVRIQKGTLSEWGIGVYIIGSSRRCDISRLTITMPSAAIGINALSDDVRIVNCQISGTSSATGIGIVVSGSKGVIISDNAISEFGSGIWLNLRAEATYFNNEFVNCTSGLYIKLDGENNTFTGVTTPVSGEIVTNADK
jgi:nitrous oxidase accessory protein NosD